MKWTEQAITRRLAFHFGYSKNVILPNYSTGLCGWEADLVVIRPSGWAEEIEVKISAADFRCEFRDKPRKHKVLQCGHPKILYKPHTTRTYAEAHGLPTTAFDEWDEAFMAEETEKKEYWKGDGIRKITDWRHCEKHHCGKYWFAMPLDLAEKLLGDIPDHAGLIAIHPCNFNNGRVQVMKNAPRLPMAEKFPLDNLAHLLKCAYYRMWDFETGRRKPATQEVA